MCLRAKISCVRWENKGAETFLKGVRAHCYCASLPRRTQIHTPRYASSARSKQENEQ